MGLFDSIFQPKKNKISAQAAQAAQGFFRELTGYRPVFHSWDGSIYESELVRAAIDARARHISKLKVEIQGAARPTLKSRLRRQPNGWQTWSQFLYRLSTILDVHNTAFIVPVLDEKLDTIGYFPVLPTRCEVVEYKDIPWLRYEFAHGQHAAVEMYKCGILTRFQYKNDFFGETNAAMNDTLDLISMQSQGIKEAIKSGATYRFLAKLTNFSDPDDLAKERKRFTRENLQGDSGGGGLLLFPNTYTDIRQIDAKAYTADTAQIEMIRTNVFDYFGVNQDVLQSKAYGDSWSAFYEGCIEAFAVQFSEVMTKAMFTDREQAQGALVMATSNRLQYMSNADKLAFVQQMGDRGMITINEGREVFNLPPLPDGRGDVIPSRGEYYDTSTGNKIGGTEPPDKGVMDNAN